MNLKYRMKYILNEQNNKYKYKFRNLLFALLFYINYVIYNSLDENIIAYSLEDTHNDLNFADKYFNTGELTKIIKEERYSELKLRSKEFYNIIMNNKKYIPIYNYFPLNLNLQFFIFK